jgi:outer membrane protein assembly factor BamB
MRRSSRWEGLLFAAVCLTGWAPAGATEAPKPTRDMSHWCIDSDLLDHAGLTLLWQDALPVKPGERFEAMTALDERLYVRSDRNYLWSIDRNDGKIVFNRPLAPARFPILGWNAYDDRLICVIDNQLVELDVYTGQERRVSSLDVSIVAPPVRNSQFFYISGADRRVHAFRAADLVEIFVGAPGNDSLITTVVAGEESVVLGTDAGNLLALTPDAPRKLWEFKAVEATAGPVIRDGNSFFFADRDTYVYRVDVVGPTRVVLAWRYQTEGILDRAPLVTRDIVYQYAMGRGVTAIDKETGTARWSLPEGVDLLAEAGGRAYVLTKDRTLTVMENTTGRKLFWVNFAPVVNHAANTVDGKIYIADADGRVACLAPAR